MVHKWALGAFINILGSISINLGTNFMKLSHKTERTELPSGTSGVGQKPLEASPSDVEIGNSNGTLLDHHSPKGTPQRQPRCSSSAKHTHLRDVEMVTVASAASFGSGSSSRKSSTISTISEKVFQTGVEASEDGTRVKTDLTLESDHEETARLIGGDLLTGSPSSANGMSMNSDERAALLVGSQADVDTGNEPSRGVSIRHNGVTRGGKVVDEFDDRAGVRRRALTTPHTSLVVSGGDSSVNGPGRLGEDGGGVVQENKALWCTGAMLLVVGSLVNFASFGFAPQSLLASLGSVQFVSNVVFGKIILREVVTKRIVIGTATIIVGNTLTLCFSPHQEDSFDTQQLRAFYDLEYNALLLVELVIALGMHAVYRAFEKSKDQGAPRRYSDVITPLAYAVCSAIVGTQSVIQAKCLSELLKITFEAENQMTCSFTYVVITVWLGTTIFWLMRMNRALAMFHGLFIIPALQVFWTFFSVIGGGVYFEEFKSLRPLEASAFALGVFVVFLGVYLLAPRTQTDLKKRTSEATRDVGGEIDERGSDLRRMPRLEEATRRCSQASSLEAGDEDIDWERTRMLSIGFFPSISTDQDVGRLKKALRVIEPGKVVQRLKSLKASRQVDALGQAISEYATEITPGSARCHDGMPPRSSPPVAYADETFVSSRGSEDRGAGRGFVNDVEHRHVSGRAEAEGEDSNTSAKPESSTQ